MQQVLKVVTGACVLVGVATALGIASNALRQDGLPLIRKPLRETRAIVGKDQLMADAPVRARNPKPRVTRTGKSPVAQSIPVVVAPKFSAQTARQSELSKPRVSVARTAASVSQTAQNPEKRESGAKQSEPVAKKIQALFTNLKDAKACFDNKNAIFLDARLTEDYEAEHITGAVWLCYESVEEDYDKVLGQIPKDRLLITYCSDQQCASAIKLADALVARGHTRVVIMLEGLPGWKDAGYPTTTGKEAGG